MELKSYKQYLNEDLAGQYNYYGQGSLYPIVKKLHSEGKSAKIIYVYLTSLGIDEERKQKVINQVFIGESIDYETIQSDILDEANLFEDDKKVSQDDINDVLNASPDDLAKGIDPKKAKPDVDLKKSLDKLKDKSTDEPDKDDSPADTAKANLDALQAVIKDAEKLAKIKEILAESQQRLNED